MKEYLLFIIFLSSAFSLNAQEYTKKFFVPETGETVILKVSANAIRTIDKNGIASVLAKAKANGNILV